MGIGAARADFENFVSCDRATSATALVGGVLSNFAAGAVVRYPDPDDPTRGVMRVEPQATNHVRSNDGTGAAVGRLDAGGALPTGWTAPFGLPSSAVEVVQIGEDVGLPYIRIRLQGVTTSSSVFIYTEGVGAVAAEDGQLWAQSVYMRLISGSLANISAIRVRPEARASGGTGHSGYAGSDVAIGADWQRCAQGAALADANGAGEISYLVPTIQIASTSGAAIDVTLDIGLPQMELDAVTSPIRTSGAMATRAADVVTTPAPVNGGVFSVVVDFRFSAVQVAGRSARVFDFGGDEGRSLRLQHNGGLNTGDLLLVLHDAPSEGGAVLGVTLGVITAGLWQRAVVVVDGADLRVRLSGEAEVSRSDFALPRSGLHTLALGASHTGTVALVGPLEYRAITVYDRSLSSAEITELVEGAS